ncbi:VOC family protein [Spirosoma sp.]|uniref:VOC family protein n=1 Tax=Spirosoma sp. TaxID=1899569 RepID=UPI002618DC54|nr:VOC family protein [Spirosoma sp.]MCX6215777.1 VOC family protein [Spirosoma sp.]
MKLNHLNLAVSDVVQTQQFLQTYFGFQPLTKGSPVLTVLQDENGLVLTLSNFSKVTEVIYPQEFHIGFIQSSQEDVNTINQRLKDDGFMVEPPRSLHNSWTFYCQVPGGFLIEVLCLNQM